MRLAAVLLFATTCCAATAHLYNLTSGNVLSLHYSRWGSRTLWLILPSGEKLTGEFSAVVDGSVAWGSIYGSVYGTRGSASYNSNGTVVGRRGKSEGAAILVGPSEMIECEFVAGLGGHGVGACQDRAGNKYKLMF